MRRSRWAHPGVKPGHRGDWPLGRRGEYDYEFAYDAEAERRTRLKKWQKKTEKRQKLKENALS